MDLTVLGSRIRNARSAAGITQDALSELLGIPRSAVSEIENGRRGLSAGELIATSKHLRRSLDYFVADPAGSSPSADDFAVRFRSLQLQSEDAESVFRFEERCRDYNWLEDILAVPRLTQPPSYARPHPRTLAEAQQQGEDLADQERNRLTLGSDPVRDPFHVVESQGVRVILTKLLTPHVSGIFHYDGELGACILVNTAFDKNRRAYDLLHEYCHVLTDRLAGSHRTDEADNSRDPIERRANAFAAAFLLPRDGVERFLETRGIARGNFAEFEDIFYVMVAFGASLSATVYRLKELNFLSDRHVSAFLATRNITDMTRRFRKAAGVQVEDFDDPRQRRFGQLALRAYRKDRISIGRVAELLNTSLEQARELAWSFPVDGSGLADQNGQ